MMAKQRNNQSIEQKQKQDQSRQQQTENQPGYGDKKLEGPNRPST